LTMSPENTGLVLAGRKTSTIRPFSYQGKFSPGQEVQLGKTDRNVRIEEVREIRLSRVDSDILRSEGGIQNRTELLAQLKQFYPRLASQSRVLLIRFVLA
jgi:hypothetical protein